MRKRKEPDVIPMNPYEIARMQRVQECKSRSKESGITEICKSLMNLVDGKKNKKKKNEAKAPGDAKDYSPQRESFGNKDQDEERQSSNGAKVTKKLSKNKEQQPQCRQHDEESGTATHKQPVARKPMTRATAQSQKYVPPMMLKKLMTQRKQGGKVGGDNGRRKAPRMTELILKNQPQKEAAMTTPEPLVGCSGNQSPTNENLRWLAAVAELDEGHYVDGGEGDKPEDEPEIESENEEDFFDSDNDAMEYGYEEEEGYEDQEEECNGNELECVITELRAQGATGRGPTVMHKVHMRPPEKREAIILNEYGQPVGPVTPEKDTVGEFSRFLGTIARTYDNAPLTHRSWRAVPNKDKLWEYVLTKYTVPEEGKDWVLKSIGAAWRVHKCRFKKRHFRRYTTNKERWLNRPKTVPEEDFKKLLVFWNKKEEKERCAANQSRRKAKKNNHTVGPKSFARIREDMKNENPEKQRPSLVQMFESTRQRDEKKKHVDTYEDTARKIEAMKSFQPNEDGSGPKDAFLSVMKKDYPGSKRLYGRGVTAKKLNKGSAAAAAVPYVVPTEVMDKLSADMEARSTLVADIRKELETDYEEKKAKLEADYAKKMEEFDKSKELLVEEILEKLIAKLPANVVREYLA